MWDIFEIGKHAVLALLGYFLILVCMYVAVRVLTVAYFRSKRECERTTWKTRRL
jgi:hypothetical protein